MLEDLIDPKLCFAPVSFVLFAALFEGRAIATMQTIEPLQS
jgi:hypothetical protein